ncbi:hypothetical protein CsSME_00010319 [Camellia sinensis var. sinensis]
MKKVTFLFNNFKVNTLPCFGYSSLSITTDPPKNRTSPPTTGHRLHHHNQELFGDSSLFPVPHPIYGRGPSNQACKATRFPDTCESSLVNSNHVPSNPTSFNLSQNPPAISINSSNPTMGSTSETQTIHTDEEEACLFAMKLTSASVLPYVSPSEVAAQLPTKNPDAAVMLDRILRLLTSYSVLNCTLQDLPNGGVERLYGLAPVCKFLTRNTDGVSMAPLLLMNQDKVLIESWYYLKDTVLEGGLPFNKAYGMTAFEYHGTDPNPNHRISYVGFFTEPRYSRVHGSHHPGLCRRQSQPHHRPT